MYMKMNLIKEWYHGSDVIVRKNAKSQTFEAENRNISKVHSDVHTCTYTHTSVIKKVL